MKPAPDPSKALYLCLDQGGHATRAIVFNGEGEPVAETFQNIRTQHPQADRIEHDANELLTSFKQILHDICAQLGDRKQALVAAGLATQRSNIVCWHKETGEALTPVLSWQDRRAHAWLKPFHDKAEDIHKTTGLFLSPHYGASKLKWCLEHIPAVQQALAEGQLCLGPMASFLIYHLTREHAFVTDVVNASRTQLWSLHTNNWDPALLKLFAIEEGLLPECKPTVFTFGHLQLDGIDIPLELVTGDQSAAMFAYGKIQPDTAYINTGTGAFISRPSGPLKIYGRRLLTSVINQDEETTQYVLEGTVNGAGSALLWLAEEHHIEDVEQHLPGWLDEVKNPPLFFNGISGLASPFWIADFPCAFSRNASNAEKAVAVIESIVFLLCANAAEMKKLSSPPEQIQITGGLAVLDGMCQRLADLTGLPIYRPKECEATARGTAYILCGQPNHWPETRPGVWFKPANNPALLQRYDTWMSHMLDTMRQSA